MFVFQPHIDSNMPRGRRHVHDKPGHGDGAGRRVGNLSCGRGFTLLEVVLALGLTLIVISAIGVSIDLYLRLYDSGRANVEEALLARAVLRRIADDIRGTVQYAPMDAEKLTSGIADQTAQNNENQNDQSSENQDPNATQGESPSEEPDLESLDLSSTGPQSVPGLYGNSYQLQIDVSRLPRIDQYMLAGAEGDISAAAQTTGAAVYDRLSDVRNVAYYIFGDTSALALGGDPSMQMGCGLVRRDMDRASALFATQSGQESDMDAAAEVLAPEVEAIQFAYYDGKNMEWLSSWDSSQYGGLPMAVQITLTIARPAKKGGMLPPPGVYTLLVNLPAASLSSTSTSTTDASSGVSGGSGSGGSGSGGSGGGSQQNTSSSSPSKNSTPSTPGSSSQPKLPGGR